MFHNIILLCVAVGFIGSVRGLEPTSNSDYAAAVTVTATVTCTVTDTSSIVETTTVPGARTTVLDTATVTVQVTDTTSIVETTTLTTPGARTTVLDTATVTCTVTDTTSIVETTTLTVPGARTTVLGTATVTCTVTDTTSIVETTTVLDTASILESTTITVSGVPTTVTDTTSIIERTTLTIPGLRTTTRNTASVIRPATLTIPGVRTTVTIEEFATIVQSLEGTQTAASNVASAAPRTINVCPAPTNGIPVTPQDTGPDALWGCSPGFLCSPPKPDRCDIWASPPAYDFSCDKKYCKPAPPFSDVSWPAGGIAHYPITGYFNFNPRAFGLDYGIFLGDQNLAVTEWRSPYVVARHVPIQLTSFALPSPCYGQCNNCLIEAQRIGKAPILCASSSAFQSDLASCQTCAMANSNNTRAAQAYLYSEFLPFISFCADHSTKSQSISATKVHVAATTRASLLSVLSQSSSLASSTVAAGSSTTSGGSAPVTSNSVPKIQFSLALLEIFLALFSAIYLML